MVGPLITDSFMTNRFLVNGIQIVLSMTQTPNEFRLHSDLDGGEYLIEYNSARIKVCHVSVNDAILTAHNEAFKLGPAIYPYLKTELLTEIINPGVTVPTMSDVFTGKIPSRMVVAFVDQEAFTGDINRNPFNFGHFNLQSFGVRINSRRVNNEPYTLNFDEKTQDFVEAYDQMNLASGNYMKDSGIYIPRDYFSGGYMLFVYDFEHGLTDETTISPVKTGNLSIDLKFRKPIPSGKPIVMLAYGLYKAWYEVSDKKNVTIHDMQSKQT
jgi:hypothetical protein